MVREWEAGPGACPGIWRKVLYFAYFFTHRDEIRKDGWLKTFTPDIWKTEKHIARIRRALLTKNDTNEDWLGDLTEDERSHADEWFRRMSHNFWDSQVKTGWYKGGFPFPKGLAYFWERSLYWEAHMQDDRLPMPYDYSKHRYLFLSGNLFSRWDAWENMVYDEKWGEFEEFDRKVREWEDELEEEEYPKPTAEAWYDTPAGRQYKAQVDDMLQEWETKSERINRPQFVPYEEIKGERLRFLKMPFGANRAGIIGFIISHPSLTLEQYVRTRMYLFNRAVYIWPFKALWTLAHWVGAGVLGVIEAMAVMCFSVLLILFFFGKYR